MRGELHYTLSQVESVPVETGVAHVCDLAPRYNIVPGQTAPVVLGRGGMRVCEQLRWGLLPRWRGRGGKRGPLVCTAPLEAVPAMPQLRDAFKKQRCLVMADGCFAWRELKQPIWFHPVPPRPIAFAGIWDENDDDGQPSFAILLGPPLVTRVKEAMPIVLDPDCYDAWLDPAIKSDEAIELLGGCGLAGWRADAVSTRMASNANDDPDCIAPVGNPNQGELF